MHPHLQHRQRDAKSSSSNSRLGSSLPLIAGRSSQSTSTFPNPPRASISQPAISPELDAMAILSERFLQLEDAIRLVINKDEKLPELFSEFMTVYEDSKKNYAELHCQLAKFFTTVCEIKRSSPTNQVISVSSCQYTYRNFMKYFDPFCQMIDKYSERIDPPHSVLIRESFKSIRASIDGVAKTVDSSRLYSKVINQCILNIHSLTDSLSKSIFDVFSQPSFPHFETDLLGTLCTNVKTMTTLINEAFSNEFTHTPISPNDLGRMRNNVISECSQIIDMLKYSFSFSSEMREIRKAKDEIISLLHSTLPNLNQPFFVVRTLSESVQKVLPQKKAEQCQNVESSKKDAEAPAKKEDNEPSKRTDPIDDFISKVFCVISTDAPSANRESNLEFIEKEVTTLKQKFDKAEDENRALKKKLKSIKEESEEKELVNRERMNALTQNNSKNSARCEVLSVQNKALMKQIEEEKRKSVPCTERPNELEALEEASRKVLMEVSTFSEINNNAVDEELPNELCSAAELIRKYVESHTNVRSASQNDVLKKLRSTEWKDSEDPLKLIDSERAKSSKKV